MDDGQRLCNTQIQTQKASQKIDEYEYEYENVVMGKQREKSEYFKNIVYLEQMKQNTILESSYSANGDDDVDGSEIEKCRSS